jgi:hypothetical protein
MQPNDENGRAPFEKLSLQRFLKTVARENGQTGIFGESWIGEGKFT